MSEPLRAAFDLPLSLQQRMDRVLQKRFGLSLENSKEIAGAVQKMSDYYIQNPGGQTPWAERWCQIAQLAYYMPLNSLRTRAALKEGERFGFFKPIQSLVDFGAGLGTCSLTYTDSIGPIDCTFIERSPEALGLARDLGVEFEAATRPEASEHALLACSYSLTELEQIPPWVFNFEHLLLIEPSTRDEGRKLMATREILKARGFSMWAPCPHQEACPLLENNPHDWCHDRIHFNRPTWWLAFEKHLPFQNPTLTFSYLLASKRPRPETKKQVRLVGDFLPEKGKSRQMICRGPDREFFSWLKRDRKIPELPRGLLVEEPTQFRLLGSELRLEEVPVIVPGS